jgi:uncharacterized membrane protein
MFMNDRLMVSKLFPGCREVKILNDLDSLWTIAFSLGPFSRTMVLKGHTTELIENKRIGWTVSHELVVVSGTVEFREISERETEIIYRIEGRIRGPLPILQDIIIGDRMRALGRTYVQNIKEYLDKKVKRNH